MNEPFGAFRPSPFRERVRAIGARLPATYFGKKAASLLLGPAGGRARRPHDVTVFGSQKARLHPYDNICEKRVFLTPQLWDAAERAFLSRTVSAFAGETFHFLDVGANVGLYALFARAESVRSGAKLQAACVEADPEMAARLAFNIEASGATRDISIFACAATDAEGPLAFSVDRSSRGLSRIAESGETTVEGRSLLAIVVEAGLPRIDAMKVDIEGHERRALAPFFRDAPSHLLPQAVILEIAHEREGESAQDLLRRIGYVERLRTRRNVGLLRGDQAPS